MGEREKEERKRMKKTVRGEGEREGTCWVAVVVSDETRDFVSDFFVQIRRKSYNPSVRKVKRVSDGVGVRVRELDI